MATTAPELTFSLAEDLSTDGMGELAELQPQNVMYEQDKDKPFEPLPARITSESSLPCELRSGSFMLLYKDSIISTAMAWRYTLVRTPTFS